MSITSTSMNLFDLQKNTINNELIFSKKKVNYLGPIVLIEGHNVTFGLELLVEPETDMIVSITFRTLLSRRQTSTLQPVVLYPVDRNIITNDDNVILLKIKKNDWISNNNVVNENDTTTTTTTTTTSSDSSSSSNNDNNNNNVYVISIGIVDDEKVNPRKKEEIDVILSSTTQASSETSSSASSVQNNYPPLIIGLHVTENDQLECVPGFHHLMNDVGLYSEIIDEQGHKSADCNACHVGKYSNEPGSASCKLCPVDTFSSIIASSTWSLYID